MQVAVGIRDILTLSFTDQICFELLLYSLTTVTQVNLLSAHNHSHCHDQVGSRLKNCPPAACTMSRMTVFTSMLASPDNRVHIRSSPHFSLNIGKKKKKKKKNGDTGKCGAIIHAHVGSTEFYYS